VRSFRFISRATAVAAASLLATLIIPVAAQAAAGPGARPAAAGTPSLYCSYNPQTFQNVADDGRYLDLLGGVVANGTEVDLYNYTGASAQVWDIYQGSYGVWFESAAADNNGCRWEVLDDHGYGGRGTHLDVWNGGDQPNVEWHTAPVTSSTFEIWSAAHPGLCVDDPSGSQQNAQWLQLWDCNGLTAQQFY
jgi:hypothetical protein